MPKPAKPKIVLGDFIKYGPYGALVVMLAGAELVVVPVVSAKLGRHRACG